jgi:hypothetical protein
MSNVVTKYVVDNKIIVIVSAYLILSSILKATTGLDICIPCLWETIFGIHCPSCGLTSAFISLISLDYRKAMESNWIIFFVIPFGIYYLIQDYIRFKKNTTHNNI